MRKGSRKARTFWEGETCEYCGGRLKEQLVDLPRKEKDRYILIRNVPAGVCRACGTRYFSANVLKTIEETARGRRRAKKKVSMDVYDF